MKIRKLPDDYGNTTGTSMPSIDDRSMSATTISTRKKINKSPKQSKNDLTIESAVNVNN
jgi:hypothetical protein